MLEPASPSGAPSAVVVPPESVTVSAATSTTSSPPASATASGPESVAASLTQPGSIVCEQPLVVLQSSTVHGSWSSQLTIIVSQHVDATHCRPLAHITSCPAQRPVPLQLSFDEHKSWSSHTVPTGAKAFGGQFGLAPSQFSAGSHGPVDARQTAPAAINIAGGHAALVPEHVTFRSHPPSDAWQMCVVAMN
jgi:hypothetical protein